MKIETNYEKFLADKEMKDYVKTESTKQDILRKQLLEKEVKEFDMQLKKTYCKFSSRR